MAANRSLHAAADSHATDEQNRCAVVPFSFPWISILLATTRWREAPESQARWRDVPSS